MVKTYYAIPNTNQVLRSVLSTIALAGEERIWHQFYKSVKNKTKPKWTYSALGARFGQADFDPYFIDLISHTESLASGDDPATSFNRVAYAFQSGKVRNLLAYGQARNTARWYENLPYDTDVYTGEDARFRFLYSLLTNEVAVEEPFLIDSEPVRAVLKKIITQQLAGSLVSAPAFYKALDNVTLPSKVNHMAFFHNLADAVEVLLTSTAVGSNWRHIAGSRD